MRRSAKASAAALGALLALVATLTVLPGGAAAEQASQPSSVPRAARPRPATTPARCCRARGRALLGLRRRRRARLRRHGDDRRRRDAGRGRAGGRRRRAHGARRSARARSTPARCSTTATVRCWGFGGNGRLGYGNTDSIGDDEPPGAVGPVDLGAGRTRHGDRRRRRAHLRACSTTAPCAAGASASTAGSATATTSRTTTRVGDDETPGSRRPGSLGIGRHRDGDHGRRLAHVRAARRRQRALLGLRRRRPARLRQRRNIGRATTCVGDDETPGRPARSTSAPGGPPWRSPPATSTPARARRRERPLLGLRRQRPARLRRPPTRSATTRRPDTSARSTSARAHRDGDHRRRRPHLRAARRRRRVRCWGYGAQRSARLRQPRDDRRRRDAGSTPARSTSAPVARPSRSAPAATTRARASTTAACAAGATGSTASSATARAASIGDDETPAVGRARSTSACPAAPARLRRRRRRAAATTAAARRRPSAAERPGPATPSSPPTRTAALAQAASRPRAARLPRRRQAPGARASAPRARRATRGASAHERALLMRQDRDPRRACAAARCLRRFGRTPGRVHDRSRAGSASAERDRPARSGRRHRRVEPAGRARLPRQAVRCARSARARDFERAPALCKGHLRAST